MVKAFILAAGYSKRLRPLTEIIPKPLLPITGIPILEYIYFSLKNIGIKEIALNLHYKAKTILTHIKENSLEITPFFEETLLDTGGALANAKDFLKDSYFIVHNSDIFWDGDLLSVIDWHIQEKNDITLLVHNHPKENKLLIDPKNNFVGFCQGEPLDKDFQVLAYTGVSIYNPIILEILPKEPFPLPLLWNKAKALKLKVQAYFTSYTFWFDIGTPLGYAQAVFSKLKREATSLFIHPLSKGCELIEPLGLVVLEKNSHIQSKCRLKNVIILPNTLFPLKIESLEDAIVCREYIVNIKNQEAKIEPLLGSGSKRFFFRKGKRIYCQYQEGDRELERTLFIGNFLKEKNFPVPSIISFNKEKNYIVFEDLGDLTLYSWLQCPRREKEILKIYQRILKEIAYLHWGISKEPIPLEFPQFDYEYLRWESNYFIEEAVKGVFQVKPEEDLEEEFHFLALKLSQFKKVLLHRDLQSQNIILKRKKIYFIDFQGMRWGPPGYDIASLLWDPYVFIKENIRKEALTFYIEEVKIDKKSFWEELSLCRIQRHMQAIGAYGFLGLKRKKTIFLKYIPQAINLLSEDLEDCLYPFSKLKKLVKELQKKI